MSIASILLTFTVPLEQTKADAQEYLWKPSISRYKRFKSEVDTKVARKEIIACA